MSNAKLRTTFNTAPTLYEEIRPGYPEELIRDVVNLSGLNDRSRILEVGCGTGKATLSFAERGYALVCLDIGTDLIAIAREKLREFPNVSFVREAFEVWEPERTFSDHIALPDENKHLLFDGIANLIERKYNGRITKHYEAVLDLRQTR